MKALKRISIALASIVAAFAVATISINVYCVSGTRGQVHTISQLQSGIEGDAADRAIVVLGASVYSDGTPSDILADRLEVAADLLKTGIASKIIASGDNDSDHYNESDAMKSYMVELGVPEESITADPEGYDTYSSIYRAKFVYGADEMIIVSQAYHLYRALMISDILGARSVGVAADKGSYENQFQYSLRDALARDKDFFLALFKLPPTEK